MKLQFKYQKFQADAAKAVVDVFAGQPLRSTADQTGRGNYRIVLSDDRILEQLHQVQKNGKIEPSHRLEGRYNLTVEMETGVGKTYTYIKTIYELNQRYGWSKFIVVVPSIAIREGVCKSFQVTQEHFAEEYGKRIDFFVYHSARLGEVARFVSGSSIHVMIINAQAFNTRGADARRIYMKLDEFHSQRPIDLIAGTNPILIIDEPQSVEGVRTKERLLEFHPLFTLRYSATHKRDSIYNLVYRLDAVEAYNRKLVKKIAVKGIAEKGTAAANRYIYLESIHLSKSDPRATIQFDCKRKSRVQKVTRTVGHGYDLFENSGHLEEYRDGFVVKSIDGRDNSVEFANGIKLYAGDVVGKVNDRQLRRIQIRETILSHMERERQLFHKGIKALSLFFIDEVANYKKYDEAGRAVNGIYGKIFEEEYADIVAHLQASIEDEEYLRYLAAITPRSTHAGYFSVDRKGRMVDSKVNHKAERISDDIAAYDLIMKNKELLLELDPKKSPVRFLFSHSALREGWDNPNVFQICTLKQSASDIRKRQEVGRGLRLCVNENGERMDEHMLGEDVHHINVLTVIASESYDSFAKGLQRELAEAAAGKENIAVQGSMVYDARRDNVELRCDKDKLAMPEFQKLWECVSQTSVYVVDFDTEELVGKAVDALDAKLRVSRVYFQVETGYMGHIQSREELQNGTAFTSREDGGSHIQAAVDASVSYDLVGKLVEETGLTRKAVVQILMGIREGTFRQFRENPEEFIAKAAAIVNDVAAAVIVRHITYKPTGERRHTELLTDAVIRGKLGMNAKRVKKHLYDYVVYDSKREEQFVDWLEENEDVALYVKLPKEFYIPTPVGNYTPDWAIAFREETGRPIFFVAETKTAEISGFLAKARLHCAKEHFRAVGGGMVVCDVAENVQGLLGSDKKY